jgi:tRNA modification GTPase
VKIFLDDSNITHIAQREAAIVTSIPGTTRDVLQLTLDIGGMPVVVADTAGVRKTKDEVEIIGIERGIDTYVLHLLYEQNNLKKDYAAIRVKNADIALCVLSLADPSVNRTRGVDPNRKYRPRLQIPESIVDLANSPNTYLVFNKSDLIGLDADNISLDDVELPSSLPNYPWILSLAEKRGTNRFVEEFGQELQRLYSPFSSQLNGSGGKDVRNVHAPIITRARHREHLQAACSFLEAFLDCSKFVFSILWSLSIYTFFDFRQRRYRIGS